MMDTIFYELKNFNIDLKIEFQEKKIDISRIVDMIKDTIFEIDKIDFIYDNDLILSLKLKNQSEEFYAEIRFLTYKEFVTDIYFYRV